MARRKDRKKGLVLALMCMAMGLLSGCLFRPVEDLYRLPERFPGDESLQTEITRVRKALETESGAVEYANIFSGDNTATIQLQDLDGDGERETAVTFFRVPGADRSIKIFFFTKTAQETYRVSGVIQGEGSAIYAVDFVDLNGLGDKEVVVSWQARGMYQLGAYTLDDCTQGRQGFQEGQPVAQPEQQSWDDPALAATELLMTGCSSGYSLIDLDQDGEGRVELAIPRVDTAGANSYLEIFGWKNGTMISLDSVGLSSGITIVNKLRSNYVTDFIPALYVNSTLVDGGRATDIVAYHAGELRNLTLNIETGISRETLREYGDVGVTDINSDAVLEVPRPKALPIYGEGAMSDFWLIEWSQYDDSGAANPVFTTYHNVIDGWYLIIPDHWKDRITISRDDSVSGQRTVVFSLWNGQGEEPTPFLAVYKLTGPNRFTRAELSGRFELGGDSTTIYAAAFFTDGWDCGVDEVELLQNFRRIISSWSSD